MGQRVAKVGACSLTVMALNPVPDNFHLEQFVINDDGEGLRRKSDDERTEAGSASTHRMYVLAAPIAVSQLRDHILCACCRGRSD